MFSITLQNGMAFREVEDGSVKAFVRDGLSCFEFDESSIEAGVYDGEDLIAGVVYDNIGLTDDNQKIACMNIYKLPTFNITPHYPAIFLHAYNTLELYRIDGVVRDDNIASQTFASGLGAKNQGPSLNLPDGWELWTMTAEQCAHYTVSEGRQ